MKETTREPAETVTAVVLAGGKGRRMQGQDKGLIEIAGRPLVSYVIERLRPQVDTVLVSANRNQRAYADFADAVLSDDPQLAEDYAGPLAGILAGLEVATTEFVLVTPCDTPCLPESLLPELMAALHKNQAEIAYVHDGERDQYLIMLVHRKLAPELREWLQGGRRAVHEWIASRRYYVAKFSEPAQFMNLNTNEDCAAFALHGCKKTT